MRFLNTAAALLAVALALTLLADSGVVRAAPCPAVGVDSRADGYVLTTHPDSDTFARLVAPDCSVTRIILDTELATSRPGRPVIIPIIGGSAVAPKQTLRIEDQVIAQIHRLPSATQKLSFGKCPTFSGGADLTNARRLESFIINKCPAIETLDNVQFPDSVTYIGVENTGLKSIKNVVWPLSLDKLFLRSNKLTSIESVYPESMSSLMLGDNPITKLDRGDMPRAMAIVLPAVTSIKGVTWPELILFPLSGSTLTEFEIRESDVEKLERGLGSLNEKIKQSACSDPTATLQNVGDNDVCVISDDRFETLYRQSTVPVSPTIGQPPVNATTPTVAPATSRPPSPTSTATGSGSGSGSMGEDLLEDITLPDGQSSTRRRKSEPQDATQDEEVSPSSRASDGSGSEGSGDAAPGTNGGGARRGASSPSTRLSGSLGGSKDGDSSDASSASASSSIVRTTIFAAVGALMFLALFVVGYYRRSTHREKGHGDTSESPMFAAFPATPQSSVGSEGNAPLVGFLANDVRNDESLAPFRIAATEIALDKVVARGGFGVVHRGVFRDRDVAVKQMQPGTWRNEAALARFMDEIRLCAKLKHDKIVEFVGISWTSLRDLSVVSEFMGGGDLHDALRKQSTPSRVDWYEPWTAAKLQRKTAIARDVAEAVVYLHSRTSPVLHRDLKARNVLLDERGHAKLSDFGISREVVVDETLTSEIGTAAWIAPEVLRGERYSEKADVYSFGVLLVELDLCRHPYAAIMETDGDGGGNPSASPSGTAAASLNAFQNANIILMVSTGKLRPGLSTECPEAIKALAEQCLSFDASSRPSSSDLYERLQSMLAE